MYSYIDCIFQKWPQKYCLLSNALLETCHIPIKRVEPVSLPLEPG